MSGGFRISAVGLGIKASAIGSYRIAAHTNGFGHVGSEACCCQIW